MNARQDALLIGALLLSTLATMTGALVVAPWGPAGIVATALLFGFVVCWCSNTVSHVHLHRPLFRSRPLNRALSLWITLVTGVPQSLWRRRHFWHHAGETRPFRMRLTPALLAEGFALTALAIFLGVAARLGTALALGLGYAFGMGLCSLQGRMEHHGAPRHAPGVSYYGTLYNVLSFNDGYHAEHHAFPHVHWSRLPERRLDTVARVSALPPLVRGFEGARIAANDVLRALVPRVLCAFERALLATKVLEGWVLGVHHRALAGLVGALPSPPARVVIVGGGLFPRSFLALRSLLPASRFLIIDQCQGHIDAARGYLERRGVDLGAIEFRRGTFDGRGFASSDRGFRSDDLVLGSDDLVVVPLAYEGPRGELGVLAGRASLITHEWLWRRSPVSRRVSVLLLKRVNLFVSP